ncbi:MAG: hypothetical protein ACR2PB_07400 [Desulfocapsaceae bacterium]
MKWLEVIHLRSAKQDSDLLDIYLDQLVDDISKEEGSEKINLFRRADLETDVCLQLHHESEQVKLPGSRLGMHLAEALKKFGMVNHAVWVDNRCETSN